MSAIRVGVCIPAYDEVDEVAATVRSVLDSGYPVDALQVVVAVDGGDPRVAAAAKSAGATVVVEVIPNQGSYAARNAAIAQLSPDVSTVLFTDTGCSVAPGWVDAHLRALAEADLSGGAVVFTFDPTGPTAAGWVDSLRHLRQEYYVTEAGFAATCNLAVRRSVVDEMRFDATLRTGGDAEFCRRAVASGKRLVYTPDARIDHPARRTRRELFAKVHRIASGTHRQRDRWVERGMPPHPRFRLRVWRLAHRAGVSKGPIWGLYACTLDYIAAVKIIRAVQRTLREPPADHEGSTPS